MNAHLVWGKEVDGEVVCLYLGEDPVQADAIYHEHHLDGAYEYVKWAVELRHFRHTTPAKDGCAVKVGSEVPIARVEDQADGVAPEGLQEVLVTEEVQEPKKAKGSKKASK
jgi:hypothetical protein